MGSSQSRSRREGKDGRPEKKAKEQPEQKIEESRFWGGRPSGDASLTPEGQLEKAANLSPSQKSLKRRVLGDQLTEHVTVHDKGYATLASGETDEEFSIEEKEDLPPPQKRQ